MLKLNVIKNKKILGKTPLTYAEEKGLTNIVELLKSYGAEK